MTITIENARYYTGPGWYVGRPHTRFPQGSPLGNPFREYRDGTRVEVIARYRGLLRRAWLINSPAKAELLRLAEQYRQNGALTLICWCYPQDCHAETIAESIREIVGQSAPDITSPIIKQLFTGSREATPAMLDLACQRARIAGEQGRHIIVGDADGVDAAVIDECDRLGIPVEVHGGYNRLRRETRSGQNFVHAGDYLRRDRLMAERADFVEAIWNGKSRGTKYTADYAFRLCKTVCIFDHSKSPVEGEQPVLVLPSEFLPAIAGG